MASAKILLLAGCLAVARAGVYPAAYAPVGYATAEHPVQYATAEHPVQYATAEHPVQYATAEHPVQYATAEHPVQYATAEHPAEYATAPHPVAYAAAEHVAYAAPVAPVAYAAAKPVVPAVAYAAAPVAYAAKSLDFDPNPEYKFSYDVQDDLTGDSKSQTESRKGDVVHGSYSLDDPDGTRRTVDYTSDPINGFNAVVRKEPQAPKYVVPAYAAPAAVAYHRK